MTASPMTAPAREGRAARRLIAEVRGLLASEMAVRAAIGNTNWSCLQSAADDAEIEISSGISARPDEDCRSAETFGDRTQMSTQSEDRNNVQSLIKKAASADKSEDAMKFSQAACNAANALCALKSSETIGSK